MYLEAPQTQLPRIPFLPRRITGLDKVRLRRRASLERQLYDYCFHPMSSSLLIPSHPRHLPDMEPSSTITPSSHGERLHAVS